jgi:hypothetical protein
MMIASTIAILATFVPFPVGKPVEGQQKEIKAFRTDCLKRWESVFGVEWPALKKNEPPEAARDGYFRAISKINPQPLGAFKELSDFVYTEEMLQGSYYWHGKFITKDCCVPDVRTAPPKKYYLSEWGTHSLVFHEWKTAKYGFKMYESGNGVLIRILPAGYVPKKSMAAADLAKVIRDVLNVDYKTTEATIEAFRLPKEIKPGDLFANCENLVFNFFLGEWNESVVGFLSDADICLVCQKIFPRMAMIFEIEPDWLDKRLMQKDGKTLVRPKKEKK